MTNTYILHAQLPIMVDALDPF